MAFKIGQNYTCPHTEDDKLEVVHVFNPTLCKLKIGATSRHFIAKDRDTFGKHITLAHVSDLNTELTLLEEELIKW